MTNTGSMFSRTSQQASNLVTATAGSFYGNQSSLASSSSSTTSSSASSSSSKTAIIAGVVGGFAGIALIAALFLYYKTTGSAGSGSVNSAQVIKDIQLAFLIRYSY